MIDSALLEKYPELRDLLTPRLNRFIPHDPHVKQAAFLLLNQREALYGGAAGGGKSDALLMAAAQYVDVPGYAALILRRSYQDLALPGALLDRAFEWWGGTDARYSSQDHRWSFPGGGSITFGYLQTENDKYRYASAEFQFIAFDELTEFPETQYRFLFSRLRRLEGVEIPLRMRSATNPVGPYVEWVENRFVTDPDPDRPFIPASVFDNPYLDVDEYIKSLELLDPVTRQQLLEGKWGVRPPGSYFRREWYPKLRPDELERVYEDSPYMDRVRYWDLAATEPGIGNEDPDYTVGAKLTRSQSGIYYVEDVKRVRVRPHEIENLIRRTAQQDGTGVEIHIEQEPGASGKALVDHLARNVVPEYAVYGNRVTGKKEERAKPLSAASERGHVFVVRAGWNDDLFDELETFPDSLHDDQVDALSGAFGVLAGRMASIGQGPDLWT